MAYLMAYNTPESHLPIVKFLQIFSGSRFNFNFCRESLSQIELYQNLYDTLIFCEISKTQQNELIFKTIFHSEIISSV
jgi:hypothetical protein